MWDKEGRGKVRDKTKYNSVRRISGYEWYYGDATRYEWSDWYTTVVPLQSDYRTPLVFLTPNDCVVKHKGTHSASL